jgi:hypothetical protein
LAGLPCIDPATDIGFKHLYGECNHMEPGQLGLQRTCLKGLFIWSRASPINQDDSFGSYHGFDKQELA